MKYEEQYPGLFEEFRKWHKEQCPLEGAFHETYVNFDFSMFMKGTASTFSFPNSFGPHHTPEHLIVMRDMALI